MKNVKMQHTFVLLLVLAVLFNDPIICCREGEYGTGLICNKCSPSCPGYQVLVQKCNSTHDIVCQCPSNKYWHNGLLFCKICKLCLAGQYALVPCTHGHDRECKDCPEGTFYNKPVGTCKACTHCQPGEVVVKVCNKEEDTTCHLPSVTATAPVVPTVSEKLGGSPTPLTKQGSTAPHEDNNNNWLIITVTVCILVFFILGIVGIILCTKAKSKSPVPDTSNTMFDEESDFRLPPPATPVLQHDPGMLFRDVDYYIFESICNLLNPQSIHDWHNLAGRLKIPTSEVMAHGINKEQACQNMLRAWQTQRGSTVYVIYCHLKEMHRDDAACLLKDVLISAYKNSSKKSLCVVSENI